ncbi:pseudouridine-metabolizing bifunctional protein C1861.05 [Contarinia nasturtii]|uniref:pseudouridine-metabolizing bifunctional protein C1861.05 n=1 Tax=Contarinia nasturtii TaxID=265458 RepID=UPI0012D4A8EB|nr:pseudouridine-metabolizing bifunctional protein C1861.05 [Contarinia nasturtii]
MFRLQNSIKHIRQYTRQFNSLVDVRPDILDLLKANKPIVALESTIISHGMPYPQNVQTAQEVEDIVRNQGSIPATIAILNGRIKVGLSDEHFEVLGKGSKNVPTVKTSRRDLAYVLSKGLNGGTTVSATSLIANSVGIDIFATGGIGGVHRDFDKTLDISADLTELGRSSMAIVSSGVKSILDIPKTLEYLETQGVCVTTYGTDEKDFPAFFSRKSGFKAPYNINSPIEAAKLIITSKTLNLNSSILIAVPVPEEYAMNGKDIDAAIEDALQNAKSSNIQGKEITPYLLSVIGKITNNQSLNTNIALIKNNARVAAQIAVELSKIKQNIQPNEAHYALPNHIKNAVVPVVVGGSILDMKCIIEDDQVKLDGATYRTKFLPNSGGGVGRNMAEGLCKLHGQVKFISKIGNDKNGEILKSLLSADCQECLEIDAEQSTATCIIVLDKAGDSKITLANMDIHQSIDSSMIRKYEQVLRSAPIVIFDANIPIDSMGTILELCKKYNKPAFFEPTDMRLATKPFTLPKELIKQIKFTSPNIYELDAIAVHLGCETLLQNDDINIEDLFQDNIMLEKVKKSSELLAEYIDNVIITLGPLGVLLTRKNTPADFKFFDTNLRYNETQSAKSDLQHRFYWAKQLSGIVNVSGAGDSFCVGFITAMLKALEESVCFSVGMECAKAAIQSPKAVPNKYFDRNHECFNQPIKYKIV